MELTRKEAIDVCLIILIRYALQEQSTSEDALLDAV